MIVDDHAYLYRYQRILLDDDMIDETGSGDGCNQTKND